MALSQQTLTALRRLGPMAVANELQDEIEKLENLTQAEADVLDGASAGDVVASKAVVADSSARITDADLTLNSTNEINVQIGGASFLALDDAAIASHAAAAATDAKDIFIETPDGGTAAADAHGKTGGDLSVKAGDGSAGGAHTSNNPNGGAGGSVIITAGAGGAAGAGGSGVAGAPGAIELEGFVKGYKVQVIDMADAAVTLTRVPGTPVGTLLTGNILFVDANSSGSENLLLPPEADMTDVLLIINNTGGETINLQNDAGGAVATIATAEDCFAHCDGTTWRTIQHATTT